MSMAQEGRLNLLDVKEGDGVIAGGGSPEETLNRSETVAFGVGKCFSESINRAETVVITNA